MSKNFDPDEAFFLGQQNTSAPPNTGAWTEKDHGDPSFQGNFHNGLIRGDGSTLKEREIWRGRPSLWLAIEYWVVTIFLVAVPMPFWPVVLELAAAFRLPIPAWAIVPIVLLMAIPATIKTLEIYCTQYRITTQRLFRRYGILSTVTDEIELHRIRDTEIREPFHLRVMGLGNVLVVSRDQRVPLLVMSALRHPEAMRDMLRHCVLKRQKDIGWRETEVT